MTKFCTLYSSSSGNCTLISDGDTNILIDAGVSASKICKSLDEAGVFPEEIDAILITHEHSDHISGIRVFAKKYNTPVYATARTMHYVLQSAPTVSSGNAHIITDHTPFAIRSMRIKAFSTPHDSADSVGYVIVSEDKKYGIATDTGTITKAMLSNLAGCEAVLIESNHDEEMLRSGPYPKSLQNRILSDCGHLSNSNGAWLATQLAIWGTKRIALGHLSEKNNTPEKAYECAKNMLESNNIKPGADVILKVAPVDGICMI
ncbi:MAG: MBL fold metallo-hydrolase [Clostridia bacterium]|nr:MBL fold metallo-hydrolase [Clostridia bacterium]